MIADLDRDGRLDVVTQFEGDFDNNIRAVINWLRKRADVPVWLVEQVGEPFLSPGLLVSLPPGDPMVLCSLPRCLVPPDEGRCTVRI